MRSDRRRHRSHFLLIFFSIAAMHAPLITFAQTISTSIDIVIDRDHSALDFRVPVASLIQIDAASGATANAADPSSVAKAHADQIAAGIHVLYDGAALKPKVLDARVITSSLVDSTSQPLATYVIEYTNQTGVAEPKVISVDCKDLFKPATGESQLSMTAAFRWHMFNELGVKAGRFDAASKSWTQNVRWPAPVAAAPAAPAEATPAASQAPPQPSGSDSLAEANDDYSPEQLAFRRNMRIALIGGAGVLLVVALVARAFRKKRAAGTAAAQR